MCDVRDGKLVRRYTEGASVEVIVPGEDHWCDAGWDLGLSPHSDPPDESLKFQAV